MSKSHPLRDWRNQKGLSQNDLAEKVGVVSSQISQIETGHRRPSLTLAVRLSALTGISIDVLAAFSKAKNEAAHPLESLRRGHRMTDANSAPHRDIATYELHSGPSAPRWIAVLLDRGMPLPLMFSGKTEAAAVAAARALWLDEQVALEASQAQASSEAAP
jgi:transcriptional regulator with XRE-family HTH domain